MTAPSHLSVEHKKLFVEGSEIYAREGHCITCHQGNGKGLPDSGFLHSAEPSGQRVIQIV